MKLENSFYLSILLILQVFIIFWALWSFKVFERGGKITNQENRGFFNHSMDEKEKKKYPTKGSFYEKIKWGLFETPVCAFGLFGSYLILLFSLVSIGLISYFYSVDEIEKLKYLGYVTAAGGSLVFLLTFFMNISLFFRSIPLFLFIYIISVILILPHT